MEDDIVVGDIHYRRVDLKEDYHILVPVDDIEYMTIDCHVDDNADTDISALIRKGRKYVGIVHTIYKGKGYSTLSYRWYPVAESTGIYIIQYGTQADNIYTRYISSDDIQAELPCVVNSHVCIDSKDPTNFYCRMLHAYIYKDHVSDTYAICIQIHADRWNDIVSGYNQCTVSPVAIQRTVAEMEYILRHIHNLEDLEKYMTHGYQQESV